MAHVPSEHNSQDGQPTLQSCAKRLSLVYFCKQDRCYFYFLFFLIRRHLLPYPSAAALLSARRCCLLMYIYPSHLCASLRQDLSSFLFLLSEYILLFPESILPPNQSRTCSRK